MAEVPQTIIDVITSKLKSATITKAVWSENGYNLHILAADGGLGSLRRIDEQVAEAANELRAQGVLEESLHVTVGTWY